MKCPHCLENYVEAKTSYGFQGISVDADGTWGYNVEKCPACNRFTICLWCFSASTLSQTKTMVHPKGIARSPLPPEVPQQFAQDYREACLVLPDSPKASAALSRRCLQHILRDAGKTKKKDLADQIEEVMATLPTQLGAMIDSVRVIGNFSAHPIKSTHTGEIIDVEPGEAEWLLDTLELVFDFYFVQPAVIKRKREAINRKLAAASKPPLK